MSTVPPWDFHPETVLMRVLADVHETPSVTLQLSRAHGRETTNLRNQRDTTENVKRAEAALHGTETPRPSHTCVSYGYNAVT